MYSINTKATEWKSWLQATPHLHESPIGVVHRGGLAMHDTRGRSDNFASKDLPYALMPHAHPKYGKLSPKFLYSP